MPLQPGTSLGPYAVTALIGEGGMGQVYQATDTKLNRQVALKILPEAFASDPDRLARFQREAQVLASLNHPNIAQIHGIEEAEDTRALVLELVEGPTLADRIAQGAIPIDEALPIAKQIAEALEVAHEQGIIHRDLKPANIKVREDGTVKVLDFGLAKALDTTAEDDPSQSPTLTAAATQMGVIMGTAAYMSPEQASGSAVDKRADIWSFGVVLFEMLTGHGLFGGKTVSHVLASVLKTDPDWKALPVTTPQPLRRLLRRCLEKEPKRRLRDVSEALVHLEEAATAPAGDPTVPIATTSQPSGWRAASPLALGALIAGSLITGLAVWSFPRTPLVPVSRLEIALPPERQLELINSAITLSPDGTHLVFGAAAPSGESQLYLRRLDQFEPVPIPGTEGATLSFFSPDGDWLAFASGGGLRKVPVVAGSASVQVATWQGEVRGASWGPEDMIVFGSGSSGLGVISALGGVPSVLTTPAVDRGERAHWYPQVLPGGREVLFTVSATEGNRLALFSRDTGEWHTFNELGEADVGRYLPTGHLLFSRNGSLLAVRFDPSRGLPVGEPTSVVENVHTRPGNRRAHFSVSDTGTLAVVPGVEVQTRLLWVDSRGQRAVAVADTPYFHEPRLAADGIRVAVPIHALAGNHDIWIYDLERGTSSRLTTEHDNNFPVWTPDNEKVTFTSNRLGSMDLYWVEPGETGEPELLLEREHWQVPRSWSPDGQVLAFEEEHPETGVDIWMLPLGGEPEPFLNGRFDESTPAFSPDGRWVAYVSNESGQPEVYVQPFAEPGGRVAISRGGWHRTGLVA